MIEVRLELMLSQQKGSPRFICFAFGLMAVQYEGHEELFPSFFASDRAKHVDFSSKSKSTFHLSVL